MSTHPTPTTNKEISITRDLVNQVNNLDIDLDSERAHDLATSVTDEWVITANSSCSQKHFHLPKHEHENDTESGEPAPRCDRACKNWRTTGTETYPVGWHPICKWCFAWLLATHYPLVLTQTIGDKP